MKIKPLILGILKIVGVVLLVVFLTALTQVGGLIFLLAIPLFRFINKKTDHKLKRRGLKVLSYMVVYSIATFLIVPLIAKPLGRVPLPITSNEQLKPLNWMTCFLNRHYVDPKLLAATESVAQKMQIKYPETVLAYLDANFPFLDKFPLLPHLSHNDGKKLDVAFLYNEPSTTTPAHCEAPSFIGYGAYEEPVNGEVNQPAICANKGQWQYSILQYVVPNWSQQDLELDKDRTAAMIKAFTNEDAIGKLFLEPHLKSRLGLSSSKIRFHGCQAVRHDDHVHVQLK